jgi:hypothetical protein
MNAATRPWDHIRIIARQLGGDVSGTQVLAPGPGHSAADRSLSIKLDARAPDGFVVHSFAGDDPIKCKDYVREKLGLDAFKPNGNGSSHPRAVAVTAAPKPKPNGNSTTYDYTDVDGALLYQVLRYVPKGFSQRRPNGNGGWIPNLDGVRRVLYRLPELLQYPDGTVFVCEGEKDADRVASLGHCATTVAAGAWRYRRRPGAALEEVAIETLAGRDILILEDNDKSGRDKALKVAQLLHGKAKTVRIVRLPGLPEEGDVSDWLDAGHSGDELVKVCFDTPIWQPSEEQQTPLLKSSAEFIAAFVPPDYVVVGVMQRRFLYALTGMTGAGKTSIGLLLAVCAALGFKFAGCITKKIRVLYAAAENPDDVRMRWIALAGHMGFDPKTIDGYFTDRRFKISEMEQVIAAEAQARGGNFGLVIVDTSPAFFEGDDESSRSQMGAHALLLRTLIDTVPGGPCVLALCHPVKNPDLNNLLPAGGGTFLNEIDGNLTAIKSTDITASLHWAGKFRGPEFAPLHFILKTVTHPDVADSDGRLLPQVICEALSEEETDDIVDRKRADENDVLAMIAADPAISSRDIAIKMGWKLTSGEPYQSKALRYVNALLDAKLIKTTRTGRHLVTEAGQKAIEEVELETPKIELGCGE